MRRITALIVWLVAPVVVDATSLRFYGNVGGDIGRVKIPIDDPANDLPGPPADIGDSDFTIEAWIKPDPSNDRDVRCGPGYDWISGNIFIDRDRWGQGRGFGLALANGRVAFGIVNEQKVAYTLCDQENTDLRDGQWHHVAVQRRFSDGFITLYVDGRLKAQVDGPDGDVSYPDDGRCGSPSDCANSDHFLVFGAEKHDVAGDYAGLMDEVRLSRVIRYHADFTPPSAPFPDDDPDTLALYHFDEGSGTAIVDAMNNRSPGELRVGGSPPGPVYVADTPFTTQSDPATVQFSQSEYQAGEGTPAATIGVTRSGGSTGAVTVEVVVEQGTATQGADYTLPASTILSWGANAGGSRSLSIGIVDDSDPESPETVLLSLRDPTGGATLGARSTATLTITDDDTAPSAGSIQLSAASYTVEEGAGSVSITLSRTSGSAGQVGVTVATTAGSAAEGSDFTGITQSVTWQDGDSADRTISIGIVGDSIDEQNETFTVALRNPTGGAMFGTPASASVTIVDDDTAGEPPRSDGGDGGGGGALGALSLLVLLQCARDTARRRRMRWQGTSSHPRLPRM